MTRIILCRGDGKIVGKVLVYKNPGKHWGDVHAFDAVWDERLNPYVGPGKYTIFFSVQGDRPVVDEIANSDLDGDLFWVCDNSEVIHKLTKQWVLKFHLSYIFFTYINRSEFILVCALENTGNHDCHNSLCSCTCKCSGIIQHVSVNVFDALRCLYAMQLISLFKPSTPWKRLGGKINYPVEDAPGDLTPKALEHILFEKFLKSRFTK